MHKIELTFWICLQYLATLQLSGSQRTYPLAFRELYRNSTRQGNSLDRIVMIHICKLRSKTRRQDHRQIYTNSSGVYICKSIVNDLRHGNFIYKSEGIYLATVSEPRHRYTDLVSSLQVEGEGHSEVDRGRKLKLRPVHGQSSAFQWSLHMEINSKWLKTWKLRM